MPPHPHPPHDDLPDPPPNAGDHLRRNATGSFPPHIRDRMNNILGSHFTPNLFKKKGYGFIVLIKKGNRVLYNNYYGHANIELGVPISNKSIFRIASMTKPHTSCGILKLQSDKRKYKAVIINDKGKKETKELEFNISQPIHYFFPNFPKHSSGKPIEIKHLLSHNSGIAKEMKKVYDKLISSNDLLLEVLANLRQTTPKGSPIDLIYPNSFVDYFIELMNYYQSISEPNAPKLIEPGTYNDYSNFNFVLLGSIIEKVSGLSFEQYMKEYVFDPIGVKTRVDDSNTIIKHGADGYWYDRANPDQLITIERDKLIFSAGNLLATAEDLDAFGRAYLGGKIVTDTDLLKQARTPYLENGIPPDNATHVPPHYGYGWIIRNTKDKNGNEVQSIWHNGRLSGFSGNMIFALSPSSSAVDLSVILLSNYFYVNPDETVDQIIEILSFKMADEAINFFSKK